MLICAKCKKEMKCKKNGVRCRWNGSHVYAGDLFECPGCGNQTINTGNTNAHYSTHYTDTELDYYMDSFYEDNVKTQHNINLRRKRHA